ncbi:MAG TPA: NAD(P)/FAD-dependent oxidoreductase, partial [Burkholderiales bacterium]|nr:NAD(P)/FAD-dependent oxidoreductase [Burkholderiales bacterium]
DSESHVYRYFFSRELSAEWQSSERYPGASEIRAYLDYVARKLDLRRDIQFGTRVVAARYDEGANRWTIETESGARMSATWLVTAVGCLSAANVPDIPGLRDFRGKWYHTGQWPREGVDFSGKRVGQIGTGSTGIQSAPVIAQTAAHLTVFQRTANYSVPARTAPLTAEFNHWVRENFEELRDATRSTINGHAFRIAERNVADVSPEQREEIYRAAWEKGGLQFRATFRDVMTSRAANQTMAEFVKARIREVVSNPEVAADLADIDHPYAAKRPPIDTEYFETFNRPNVSLVNLRKDPIERIAPQGIRTKSGEHKLDIIVFATGFDAITGPLLRMNIRGRGGRLLREDWKAGPRTYLGLQMPGYPNLFTITGPGSPSVLTNMPVAIEQHVEWITGCIAHMREYGIRAIEASEEATRAWGEHVQECARATLLWDAKHSWYFGANVKGKPQVFMPYAGGLARYRRTCEGIAARGYEGFVLDREGARQFSGAAATALPGV